MSHKHCAKCGLDKSVADFGINNKRHDGLQSYCKGCRNSYLQQWYQDNKELQKKRARDSEEKRLRHVRGKLIEYLLKHPCVDCGETDIVVLQFDHMRDKSYCVGEMLHKKHSWAKMLAEIEKCEVRCAHCHIRRTAKQQNWYKQR